MQWPWFFTGCFAVLGAVIGSFLNVCIYRVPLGRSVLRPGSQCACGTPIPWYHNIPVLAWFFLRGRAACCGRRFSVRYPLVEAVTGVLFALCWALLPWQQALPGMVFAAWLLVLAFIDLDTMLLPDAANIGLALAGVVLSVALPGLHDAGGAWPSGTLSALGGSLTGVVVGTGLLYWFRLLASVMAGREAMGEGDVILLGGIGAFCGWQGAVFAVFGGSVIGAAVLTPLALVRRLCRHSEAEEEGRRAVSHASLEGDEEARAPRSGAELGAEVPFGPWLAAGALAWFLFFRTPVAWHLERACAVLFR
ncbi:MAG: prepilin peptidase [Puniceicoccales bacterium]|nr:prepilin peptidase [Puniceicoccales bacterium]